MLRLGLTGVSQRSKAAVTVHAPRNGFAVARRRLPRPPAHRSPPARLRRGPPGIRTDVVAPDGRVYARKARRHCLCRSRHSNRLNAIVHPRVAESSSVNSRMAACGLVDAAFVRSRSSDRIRHPTRSWMEAWGLPVARLTVQLERLLARASRRCQARRRIAPSASTSRKNCVSLPTNRLFLLSQETRRQVDALAGKAPPHPAERTPFRRFFPYTIGIGNQKGQPP